MEDFEEFQKYFRKYQQLFGLTGYKLYFTHEAFDGSFAEITVKNADRVALVRLNKTQGEFRNIKDSAKHEALHLLLSTLEEKAINRYITTYDINDEIEELVRKLEGLIKE